VRVAKAAASDLETLTVSITIRLSRANNSNNPMPPGRDGIDAPMLVIAVMLAAEENTWKALVPFGMIFKLIKTE